MVPTVPVTPSTAGASEAVVAASLPAGDSHRPQAAPLQAFPDPVEADIKVIRVTASVG
jgi:hypothetical protein